LWLVNLWLVRFGFVDSQCF